MFQEVVFGHLEEFQDTSVTESCSKGHIQEAVCSGQLQESKDTTVTGSSLWCVSSKSLKILL